MLKRILIVLVVSMLLFGCGKKEGADAASNPDSASPSEGSSTSSDAGASTPSDTAPPANEIPEKAYPPEMLPTEKWENGYLPQFAQPESGTPLVTLKTSMGDIKMMLFPQAAPLAVESFVTHCKDGYYDGIEFHRIINDFMIQGGDPTATGTSGNSIWEIPFMDEPSDHLHHFRGALSMANAGPHTNGSQFFIVQSKTSGVTKENAEGYKSRMLFNEVSTVAYNELTAYVYKNNPSEADLTALTTRLDSEANARLQAGVTAEDAARFDPALEKYLEAGGKADLDYKHTVFGHVLEGMDVVDKIAKVATTEAGKPTKEPVVILSTVVEIAP